MKKITNSRSKTKVNGIKDAEDWQSEYRKKYDGDYPSVKFIRAIQGDSLRIAGNTVYANKDKTKDEITTIILEAAGKLE